MYIRSRTIVGVSLDKSNSRALWLGAIKSDGLPWLQLSDLKFWDAKLGGIFDAAGKVN